MEMQFFFFLVFLSIASFALAFIAYVIVLRLFGENRIAQAIIIPLVVVAFDFTVMVVPKDYTYLVGSIPMAGVAGLIAYAYFFKGVPVGGSASVQPTLEHDEKKYSAKSARIHAARAKRGRK